MKTAFVSVILAAFVLLSATANAGPSISIYTDAEAYQSGDTIEVILAAKNHGLGIAVDAYIGFFTADGGVFGLGPNGWSDILQPWMPNVYVPAWFSFGPTPLWWFDVPCTMPPISEEGEYCFVAVLMRPGTLEWVCEPSLAPFTFTASAGSHYYVDAEAGDDSNDGSEGSPWKTITHALASALSTPATIHVAAGTYAPSTNGETFPVNARSYVSLRGENASRTILNAEMAANNVICCDGVNNLTIEGFTIEGGWSHYSGDEALFGAGIFCVNHSSPTIANNIITGNHVDWAGGGICCLNQSSPTIRHNTITGNYSSYFGGGISCKNNSSPIITYNIIIDNGAFYFGGGIDCSYDSLATISDNMITNNQSGFGGGGIFCAFFYEGGSPTILNNLITDNVTSDGDGGGIFCGDTAAFIANNIIVGNTALNGGGLSFMDNIHSAEAMNNLITDNNADCGGGIYCSYDSSPIIRNNTVADNTAKSVGGGISSYDSSPTIVDCIVWGNGDDLDECSGTYCCIEDDDPGEGNIHEDPIFVSAPFGDYYLNPTSPCIDAGSQSAEEAGLSDRTTQTDGTPDTERVDMGYHHPIP